MKHLLTLLFIVISTNVAARCGDLNFTKANHEHIRFSGRTHIDQDGAVSFDWSGTSLIFRFNGSSCAIRVSDTGRNYYNLFIDGKQTDTITTRGSEPMTLILARNLKRGAHTIRLQKRTEGEQGRTTIHAVGVDGQLLDPPPAATRHIEFIGDSHTCGYGTEGLTLNDPFLPETENCDLAWGALLGRYFDADYTLIAHSGQGVVRNWGDKKARSDSTMRERMMRTFDLSPTPRWDFGRIRPDVVVIKLGTNDFSPNLPPSQGAYNGAYAQMVAQLRSAYGDVPILCVAPQGLPLVRAYLEAFISDQKDKNLHWAAMNDQVTNHSDDLGSNHHPNLRGQIKMALSMAPYIATITGWEIPDRGIK